MNLLERVLILLRANLDLVIEKADDPERVLRQLQLDMRNQLVQVKTQVATAIAEGHRLQKRSQEKKGDAEKWIKKAELAVQQGNDNTARTALTHHNDLQKQAKRYQDHQKEQERLVITMRKILRQLEAKIAEVDTGIDLLMTRKRNALLQQRVFEALQQGPVEQERTSKAKDIVLGEEARAQAMAELHERNAITQLEQLEQFATEQQVEDQLQALKKKQFPSNSTPKRVRDEFNVPSQLAPQVDIEQPAPRRKRATTGSLQMPAETTTSKDIDLAYLKKLLDLPQRND